MRWLHLSDIHFGFPGYESTEVKKKLIDKLKKLDLQMDFILITGDCLYQFEKDSWDQKPIIKYIKDIAKACKCSNKKVYICPGNHDVDRENNKRNDLIQSIRDNKLTFWGNYQQLFNYGYDRFQIIYKGVTSEVYEAYKVFSPRNASYRIISIDTCLLSKDKEDYQKLKIFNEKISELEKNIRKDKRINILIMHHGIECLELAEAKKFQHWVEDKGIDIICCGHTHRAAVNSYDDLEKDIKQFTAGAIVVDNYAVPGFYICESCGENTKIEMSLYTYTTETDNWGLCSQLLRKFKNGKFIYVMSRHKEQNQINQNPIDRNSVEQEIINKDEKNGNNIGLKFELTIDNFNLKYFQKYESNRIYINRNNTLDKFDCWKIFQSLINIGVNYLEALDLTEQIINKISSPEFHSLKDIISSEEIKNIVYETLIHYKSCIIDNEYEISCYASRYARKYSRNKEIMVIDSHGIQEKLNYAYIKNTLLSNVITTITNNNIFYNKIFRNELSQMADYVFDFLKSMEVSEIREEALLELVTEFITQKPHPWLVNRNRKELLNYHIEQGKGHIVDLYNDKPTIISQMEAAYHICAAFLVQYDDFIGCTEKSPIIILTKSINNFSNRDTGDTVILPMQKFEIIQLKKDLESRNINFNDFKNNINILNKNIVNAQKTSLEETKKVLIELWGMLKKLVNPKNEIENTKTAMERVRNIFIGARGFIVKANLRDLTNCFWVEPNWEKYKVYQQHLGKQMLVCILEKISDVNLIYQYLYVQNNKQTVTEIVFIFNNFSAFSGMDRKQIIDAFKNKYVRCIFVQDNNFKQISEEQEWRNIFYNILEISKIS